MTCEVISRERPGTGPPPGPSRTSLGSLASLSAACTSSALLAAVLSVATAAEARAGTATMPASRLRRESLLDESIMGILPDHRSFVSESICGRLLIWRNQVTTRYLLAAVTLTVGWL